MVPVVPLLSTEH